MTRGTEHGGVALTVVLVGAVTAVTVLAVLLAAADVVAATGRADDLADAAALAAARALGDGRDPSLAASRVAARGGGRLERCACRVQPVTVTVVVPVEATAARRLGVRTQRATASARLVSAPP